MTKPARFGDSFTDLSSYYEPSRARGWRDDTDTGSRQGHSLMRVNTRTPSALTVCRVLRANDRGNALKRAPLSPPFLRRGS